MIKCAYLAFCISITFYLPIFFSSTSACIWESFTWIWRHYHNIFVCFRFLSNFPKTNLLLFSIVCFFVILSFFCFGKKWNFIIKSRFMWKIRKKIVMRGFWNVLMDFRMRICMRRGLTSAFRGHAQNKGRDSRGSSLPYQVFTHITLFEVHNLSPMQLPFLHSNN